MNAAIALGLLVGILFVLPLVIPVPPLRDTVPPEDLADPDSQFTTLSSVRVHHKHLGSGEPGFVLLHGFGAGTFSWREVLPTFATWGRTVAFDRPGFGLTERRLAWDGPNPYAPEAQVAFTVGLMDRLGIDKAVLVGHSAGGHRPLHRSDLSQPGCGARLVGPGHRRQRPDSALRWGQQSQREGVPATGSCPSTRPRSDRRSACARPNPSITPYRAAHAHLCKLACLPATGGGEPHRQPPGSPCGRSSQARH